MLLIMMVLIFIVQLMFSSFIVSFNLNRKASASWHESLLFSSNLQLDSDETAILLEALIPYRNQIRDVYMSGYIPTENYKETDAASGKSWTLSVIAFYPNISPERLNDGAEILRFDNENEIYLDGLLSGVLLSPETALPTIESTDNHPGTATPTQAEKNGEFYMTTSSYRINDKLWNSRGSLDLMHSIRSITDAFVVCPYNQLFELTDSCNSVNIQFNQPLNEADLLRLNQRMQNAGLSDVHFASLGYESDPGKAASFFADYSAIIAVILLLAINVLSLFDYLLLLRKNEFQVFLLSGGTSKTIWKCAVSELMICVVLAVGIGGSVMMFPFSRPLIPENIRTDFLLLLGGNILAFMGIVMVGFVLRMKIFRLGKKLMFSERGSK